MQEIWVGSRSWEDPLEKETATHSSILAWEIPWTEEPSRLQSTGSRRIGHNDWTTTRNWFSDLSSHSFDIVFCRAEVFNFNEVQLINYFFYGSYLDDESKKTSSYPRSSRFFPMLFYRKFIVLHLILRSVIHVELTFVKDVVFV